MFFIKTASLFFLVLALLCSTNIFSTIAQGRRWRLTALFLSIALLYHAELSTGIVLNAGALAVFSILFFFKPKQEVIKTAIAIILGGILAWKLCDVFPLFFDLGLMAAIPCVVFSLMYCKDIGCRLLTVIAAPLLGRLILSFCDYVLFDYAIINLGGDWSAPAQAAGCLTVIVIETAKLYFGRFYRLSRTNTTANQH